jgi:Glycosyl transferase family 2
VSVVIPTHNRQALLKEAIDSVLEQTLGDWECVVVDDASEDGTWPWLQVQADARIRTLRLDSHAERSAARNAGLSAAGGQFVVFLDDDDRLHGRALERLVAALRRHPDAVAVAGARRLFDQAGRRLRVPHPRLTALRTVWPEVLFGWVAGQGQSMFRTSLLRDLGGWNEHLATPEDQELWLRVGCAGPAVIIPAVVLENRLHQGQWRPLDLREAEEEFRLEFIRRLQGPDRTLAEQVLAARHLEAEASQAYGERRFLTAARLYVSCLREAPTLARSPVLGPKLFALVVKAAVGAVLGPRLFHTGKRLKSGVRHLLRRNPMGSVQMMDVSAKR